MSYYITVILRDSGTFCKALRITDVAIQVHLGAFMSQHRSVPLSALHRLSHYYRFAGYFTAQWDVANHDVSGQAMFIPL